MRFILTILILVGLVGLVVIGISFILPYIVSAIQFVFFVFLAIIIGIKDNPETAKMIGVPIYLAAVAFLVWKSYEAKRH